MSLLGYNQDNLFIRKHIIANINYRISIKKIDKKKKVKPVRAFRPLKKALKKEELPFVE